MGWWDLLLLPIQLFIQLAERQILPATHTGVGWSVEMWAEKGGQPSQTQLQETRNLNRGRKHLILLPKLSGQWNGWEMRRGQITMAEQQQENQKLWEGGWARWSEISSILNNPSVQPSCSFPGRAPLQTAFLFFLFFFSHENTPSAAMHNNVGITPAPLSSRCGCRHNLHCVFISLFQLWGCPKDAK